MFFAMTAAAQQQDGMAPNPFVTHMYCADPSAHVWADGRLYVYPSHDVDPPRGCDLMDRYHVFSTDDMVHWTDHGEILNSSQVEWGREEGGFMWAPDCVYKNGKYYFYFPSQPRGQKGFSVGVAVSDNPEGPFFPDRKPIEGIHGIDPCVLNDTDGNSYIYWSGRGLYVAKLKDNMRELSTSPVQIEGLPEGFKEGPFAFDCPGVFSSRRIECRQSDIGRWRRR